MLLPQKRKKPRPADIRKKYPSRVRLCCLLSSFIFYFHPGDLFLHFSPFLYKKRRAKHTLIRFSLKQLLRVLLCCLISPVGSYSLSPARLFSLFFLRFYVSSAIMIQIKDWIVFPARRGISLHNGNNVVVEAPHYTTRPSRSILRRCSVPVVII